MKKAACISVILLCAAACTLLRAADYNSFGMKLYTIESKHFKIHYMQNLHKTAVQVGEILEELYGIYRNTYHLTLPKKTEVLVTNERKYGSWALAILNMIHISLWDFDYYMRGTGDNIRDAVAHEYAHIVSIWSSFKLPSWMPYIQGGYFSHPNNVHVRENKDGSLTFTGLRLEAFHIFPSEILPPWFYEGIAQYESLRNKGDRWDSHRDMIIRALALSDKMLSFDRMTVFAGREDDWEKTYNHGFALVKYIAENYGYEKIVSMLREANKFPRVNFDRAIKAVLGISARQLYKEWTRSLHTHYTEQVKALGTQVYGKKLNKDGFANYWPRFAPDNKKVYFLSNGKSDFGIFYRSLFSYNPIDTIEEDKRVKGEMKVVNNFYDIHDSSGLIVFTSKKSRKSALPPRQGRLRTPDIFIDSLPKEKKKKSIFSKKTERQITEKAAVVHAVFSPSGDMLAGVQERTAGKYFLCLVDTAAEDVVNLYPDISDSANHFNRIYSLDWSVNGRWIAVSYVDSADRKIGIYDTADAAFYDICDTEHDERDPRFSADGKWLYFASDRSGIFNIYRCNLDAAILQRVTNVSGGAFTPDASADGAKLVYTNYDKDGFGIYQIDSLKAVEETTLTKEAVMVKRTPPGKKKITAHFTSERPYARIPRQFLFIPTFFAEQLLTQDDNSFQGVTHFKAGGVMSLNDPFDWADMGSSIGAFFLVKPGDLHRFASLDEWLINRETTFDGGVFGYTSLLPIDASFMFAVRGIAGRDVFSHDYYGDDTLEVLKYNLNPRYVDLTLTHEFNRQFAVHGLASYSNYRIFVYIPVSPSVEILYAYSPASGGRFGAFATMRTRVPDIRFNISPKGLIAKLKYEYWVQNLQNELKAFTGEGRENYDTYAFNQVSADLRYAMATPWLKKHDIYAEVDATALKLTNKTKRRLKKKYANYETVSNGLPSFFQPGAWIPGYAWYYRDTVHAAIDWTIDRKTGLKTLDSADVPRDTVVVSGNGVVSFGLSYRLPLYPGRTIDRKLGFIYFDKLYAAANFGGGIAYDDLNNFIDRIADVDVSQGRTGILNDMLLYTGAELRLEALTFSTFPLAIKARWDWGFDKNPPIGGHKFSLIFGFSFDNWDLVLEPDGRRDIPLYK